MPQSIEQKKLSAQERQAKYDAMTDLQKLERLDRAFGVNNGAKRERARLTARINKDAPVREVAVPKESSESAPKGKKVRKEKKS